MGYALWVMRASAPRGSAFCLLTSALVLVKPGLEPLVESLVVFLRVELLPGDVGDDGAGTRQARALDVLRRVPQLRAEDGAGALEEHRVDVDHDHRARQLAVHAEALEQPRVGADLRAPVDPQRLAAARNEEKQC